jgi:hypothetical protein
MILLGKIALGIAGTAVAGAGLLCSEGLVHVNVLQKGAERHHVHVIAPAMLVPIGIHFVPRAHLAEAAEEIHPWLPVIRETLKQLQQIEDLPFVEVSEPGQHVRISKSGGSIVVDVESEEESVHISTPIRAMSNAVEELAAAVPHSER